MEIFTNKSLVQKITIAIVIVILFNFTVPNLSLAAGGSESFGGVLFKPVQALLVTVGDSLMQLLGTYMTGVPYSEQMVILTSDSSWKTVAKIGLRSIVSTYCGPVAMIFSTVQNIKDIKTIKDKKLFPTKFRIPAFSITPELIFSNKVPLLDPNIVNPKVSYDKTGKLKDSEGNEVKIDVPAIKLKGTISYWYQTLRNLATVVLMIVLLYIGIRIIISSTASDKAKYKQLLKDWLIGMLLLFFMHYIISFAFTITDEITNMINNSIKFPKVTYDLSKYEQTTSDTEKDNLALLGGKKASELKWDNVDIITDFAGYVRMRSQLEYSNVDTEEYIPDQESAWMGYTIIYIILVIYTFWFTVQYLKRLINIIFLIIISPLVAMTYPIDKMKDGSAQGFNTWLKEFIFNLIIQPFHLIIYLVLIGSAIEIAAQNMIYALVVFGFMLQAEKILRKFFGFDKANTLGSMMSGAAAGALAMKAFGGVASIAKGGKSSSGKGAGKSGSSDDSGEQSRVRMDARTDTEGDDAFFDGDDSFGNEDNSDLSRQNPQLGNEQLELDETGQAWQDYINEQEGNGLGSTLDNSEDLNEEQGPRLIQNEDEDTEDILDSSASTEEEEHEITGPSTSGRFSRGFRGKVKAVGKGVAAVSPLLLRGAGKALGTAVKVEGAIAGATIGVAAGLASDSYANVATFGIAGATGGASVGKGVVKAVANTGKGALNLPSNVYRKAQDIKDEIAQNYYKDDPSAYKKYRNDLADAAFKKDKTVINQYKKAFGTGFREDDSGKRVREYEYAMEKAMNFRKHGVTDNELIINAMKADVAGAGDKIDSGQRIAAAKYAKNVHNEKDVQTMGDRLKEKWAGKVTNKDIEIQKNLLRSIRKTDS